MKTNHLLVSALFFLLLSSVAYKTMGQAEVAAWGNLKGIRVDGQLMAFETNLRVVDADWAKVKKTAKEKQRSHYRREGNKQIIDLRLDSLFFTKTIEDVAPGTTKVDLSFNSHTDTTLAGIFYCLDLTNETYARNTVQLINPIGAPIDFQQPNERVHHKASGIRFLSPEKKIEITLDQPTEIIVKTDTANGINLLQFYFTIAAGQVSNEQTGQRTFTIATKGNIDKSPVHLILDSSKPGRPFDGLGGNFRIQNPKVDPAVIDYCLDNLRVSWGRVEMPWQFWHPEESTDPTEAANKNGLHARVEAAMKMAQRLGQMGMPVLLADWWGPDWAIVGEKVRGVGPDGLRGNPLDPSKMEQIYASITDYILYIKEHYGVEIDMFSFNESDLGIDIRQTGMEHAQLIKGLGAYFASKGLKTTLLLGDTADANGHPFLKEAMADEETLPYIGAVSFHSWRGFTDENLKIWANAADQVDRPLIVGEGSIDAGAWRYPDIFEEATYAREEIDLYTRILAICQPQSILQWQLTSDYSVLSGGGVFRNNEEPLHPTQRFWNLKQLGITPAGLYAMPLTSDKQDVTCAALGDNDKRIYAIHLVNNGTTRTVTIEGLPAKLKRFHVLVTSPNKDMKVEKRIRASKGKAQFVLDTQSYTTLIGGRIKKADLN